MCFEFLPHMQSDAAKRIEMHIGVYVLFYVWCHFTGSKKMHALLAYKVKHF